ncbi:MAG TPA: SMC-Scp complex subunit ScpB [Chitinophagaceae bacterium]|nr:SMC-Scp complex subunit ScpB [Chitinophagaceae bacterium]
MEITQIIPHIEALIFATDRPLTLMEITDLVNQALGFMEDKVHMEQVATALEAIREKYDSAFYAFSIVESGGGYQFLTKKEYHPTVAQLNGDKFRKRLSTAALETLAIIAYRQPATRADIDHIRGVNSEYSVQKLLEKELIIISGRNEESPGKPLLYTVSRTFMDYFGINSTDDMPDIREIFSADLVMPTPIIPQQGREGELLEISREGELTIAQDNEATESGADQEHSG